MSHLLIVELPGGNDSDIFAAAFEGGHRVSFLTADPGHYRRRDETAPWIERVHRLIDADEFDLSALLPQLEAIHRADPFAAILCLQDLRIVEAALIARHLGLLHLNPDTAALSRDKAAIRSKLVDAGIPQPPFICTQGPAELIAAIRAIGLPVLVKPIDGFGSQNIFALRTADDLAALNDEPEIIADSLGDYGLGVSARGEMLVERLLEGQLIGCDTMTSSGQHVLLGVNEKLFFPPPSFAIRGGCFTANSGQFGDIETYVFQLLDAIGFNHGAAHIELMLTEDGPALIEINPRLVGARIQRQLSAALGRSVHADLINLHCSGDLPSASRKPYYAVTRWLAADKPGILGEIILPPVFDLAFTGATITARPGDSVTPPYDNADRLGCVLTAKHSRTEAEALAGRIIDAALIRINEFESKRWPGPTLR